MNRIVIFGNSGSGKSTLARKLAAKFGCAHLDLDNITWKESDPPVRQALETSCAAIDEFIAGHAKWVIEGCYALLIEHASSRADQMYFLNIGIEGCVENCRSRPWEPEKYASEQAQDQNLEMLIDWVREYGSRDDECSLAEHRRVFDSFDGSKLEILTNEETRKLGGMNGADA